MSWQRTGTELSAFGGNPDFESQVKWKIGFVLHDTKTLRLALNGTKHEVRLPNPALKGECAGCLPAFYGCVRGKSNGLSK